MTAPALRILRARAAGLGADRLQAQLAVQRLAARGDPDRLLPPGAILVARRARISPRGAGRLPATLDAALAPLVAQAARPARGFVPAGAEAVLFADEAELLACLSAAYASGALAGQWWWTGLLEGRADLAAVSRQWLDRPHAIAAAIDQLERRGETASVLRKLDAPFALAIAHALVAAHAAPQLALERLAPEGVAPLATPPTTARPDDRIAPWRAFGLSPQTLALPPVLQWPAALAVSLRRAPAIARGAAFAEAARRWWTQVATSAETASAPRSALAPRPSERRPSAPAAANERAARVDLSGSTTAVPSPLPPAETPEAPPVAATTETPRRPVSTVRVPDVGLSESALVAARPEPPPPVASDTPVRTAHGGLLFLLNAGLAMDLWGDFSAPRHHDLPIDPWTWLAEVGVRLLGGPAKADPIWPLLEALAADLTFGAAPPRPAPRLINAQLRALKPRLAGALGVHDVRGVRRLLLRRPAELWVSAARLDAAFDLATHPVAVRASGLDRDPGWIPAAGRDVRFQFR